MFHVFVKWHVPAMVKNSGEPAGSPDVTALFGIVMTIFSLAADGMYDATGGVGPKIIARPLIVAGLRIVERSALNPDDWSDTIPAMTAAVDVHESKSPTNVRVSVRPPRAMSAPVAFVMDPVIVVLRAAWAGAFIASTRNMTATVKDILL